MRAHPCCAALPAMARPLLQEVHLVASPFSRRAALRRLQKRAAACAARAAASPPPRRWATGSARRSRHFCRTGAAGRHFAGDRLLGRHEAKQAGYRANQVGVLALLSGGNPKRHHPRSLGASIYDTVISRPTTVRPAKPTGRAGSGCQSRGAPFGRSRTHRRPACRKAPHLVHLGPKKLGSVLPFEKPYPLVYSRGHNILTRGGNSGSSLT